MNNKLWKKKFVPILGCLFLMLAGGVFICGCQKQETESTEEIKLEEGQSWVYGQIVSINGNEITYYVMEEAQEESADVKEEREAGEKPEGFSGGERPQMPGRGENSFEGEKETITVEIPVGTQVTTRLGAVTTFSRLAAGDNIKMLVQEEEGEQVILEIWIVD